MQRLLSVFIFSIAAVAQSKPAADLIVTNAKVWTVDKAYPSAQAVAVLGDRIVAVGSAADVDPWRGPHTHVLNAGGKLLLPGFSQTLLCSSCATTGTWAWPTQWPCGWPESPPKHPTRREASLFEMPKAIPRAY